MKKFLFLVTLLFLAACSSDPAEEVNLDELSQPELIEHKVKEAVEEFNSTSILNITVNENSGTDEADDYIVLVDLSFDAKNKAGTAKDMIEMYNNDLGAKLAEVEGANELTIFWQVPYLKENENIAKANLLKEDGNMYFEEVWFDNNIFN